MHHELRQLRLRTPEGAEFSYILASPVLRLGALAIDWGVIVSSWSLLGILINMVGVFSSDLAGWCYVVSYFLLNTGYDIVCEHLWRGQTLGKRVMKLRVVDASGFSLRLGQIVARNLLRYVDMIPLGYFLGGLCSLLGRKAQRLGDIVAGTIVVWEAPVPVPDLSSYPESKYNSLRSHPHLVARLRQSVRPAQAQAAWLALRRRDQLDAEARTRLFGLMAQTLRNEAKVSAELTDGLSDEQFVRNVIEILYRR